MFSLRDHVEHRTDALAFAGLQGLDDHAGVPYT
jgi:hypothetical protein